MPLSRLAWAPVALLGTLAFAGPAVAKDLGSAGGLTYVKDSAGFHPSLSLATAHAKAKCPKGNVIGGGAAVSGRPQESYLAADYPGSDDEWRIAGWENNSRDKDQVTAWGVCWHHSASRDLQAGSAAAAPAEGRADPICDSGNAISGGIATPDPASDWWLGFSAHSIMFNGWAASAHHVHGAQSPITSFALCTGRPFEQNVKVVQSVESVITARAKCAKGTSVAGGGYETNGATSVTHLISSTPVDLKSDKDKVPDDAWSVTYYFSGKGSASVFARANCV